MDFIVNINMLVFGFEDKEECEEAAKAMVEDSMLSDYDDLVVTVSEPFGEGDQKLGVMQELMKDQLAMIEGMRKTILRYDQIVEHAMKPNLLSPALRRDIQSLRKDIKPILEGE